MMKKPKQFAELANLTLLKLDGAISDRQLERLETILSSTPAAVELYVELMTVCASLHRHRENAAEMLVPQNPYDFENESLLWEALAECEKSAVGVEVEKPVNDTENQLSFVEKRKVVKRRRKVSKLSLYTAICSTAALLTIIAYVLLYPQKPQLAEVATLTSQVNAKWLQEEGQTAILTGSAMRIGTQKLIEGFAEITFDKGAKIILQSPAEIEFEGDNQCYIHSGTLSSYVPPEAAGFVVRTPGATIVDYGTEFGVTAYSSGATEAHVFKGQIELRTGSDPIRFGKLERLTAGFAGLVDKDGILKVNLLAQPGRFTRKMPEPRSFGIPGKRLDLADIVSGGNGFGSGKPGQAIDPLTGQIRSSAVRGPRMGNDSYNPVKDNELIDGVFVPKGFENKVQISSAGHLFNNFNSPTGQFWLDISNAGKDHCIDPSDESRSMGFPRLDGQEYGTVSHPNIFMHANVGITFDLENIRKTIPGSKITKFTALCGISKSAAKGIENLVGTVSAKADFWVLVDGKLCFNRTNVTVNSGGIVVEVALSEQSRFLTLVTTDCDGNNGRDWSLFAEPALQLK